MFKRILAATAALAMSAAGATAQDDFYDGKDVTIIINLSAGGSTGVMAQLFSRHWSKHIPGNPNFVVQPVTGGGQMQGIIQAQRARPDGLTLGWVSWSASTRELGPPEQQIDWANFDAIAGMGAQAMAYMRRDVGSGVETAEDIVDVEGVRIGGYRPGSYLDLIARLSLDMLGVEHGYTTGFGGGSNITAAMQREEINLHVTPAANYFSGLEENIVETGIGLPLWYYPLTGADGMPVVEPEVFGDIRPFNEVHESIMGEAPSGPLWDALKWLNEGSAGTTWFIAAPAGLPEDRLQMLRESFIATTQDPEYLAEVEEVTGLVPTPSSHEQLEALIADLDNVDPQVVETLQGYIESGTQ